MFRKSLVLTLLVCFTLAVIPGDAMADRKRLKKPSEKRESEPAKISESRHMLTGLITVGKLLGDITKYIDEDAGKVPYGLGLGYEYYVRPNIGIGAEMRFLWLSAPTSYIEDVKTTEYRVFSILRFNPKSARTIYLKFGYGKSSGSATVSGDEVSVTRNQLRIGLGLFSFGSGKLNTRIEFSYNRMLHKDGEDIYMGIRYPKDVDYIALDFGIGLPL